MYTKKQVQIPKMQVQEIKQASLITAYQHLEYLVQDKQVFTLNVSIHSNELMLCHERNKVECSAVITSCNPLMRQRPSKRRDDTFVALIHEIKTRSLNFLPAICQKSTAKNSCDRSVLVLGISLEAAKALALRFDQRAVLWSGREAVPGLVLIEKHKAK